MIILTKKGTLKSGNLYNNVFLVSDKGAFFHVFSYLWCAGKLVCAIMHTGAD